MMWKSKTVIKAPETYVTDGNRRLGQVLFEKGRAVSIQWTREEVQFYSPYVNRQADQILETINKKLDAGYTQHNMDEVSVCLNDSCDWIGLTKDCEVGYTNHGRVEHDECPKCRGSIQS